MNLAKKENSGKKQEEKLNIGKNAFDSVQMTKSVAFPTDFTNFSKTENTKKNNDFDFGNFNFDSFGQKTEKVSNELQPPQPFPQTDFANLGKFSIAPIKKPPVVENQMFHSMPNKTIDCKFKKKFCYFIIFSVGFS